MIRPYNPQHVLAASLKRQRQDYLFFSAVSLFLLAFIYLRYFFPAAANWYGRITTSNPAWLYLFYLTPFLGTYVLQSICYPAKKNLNDSWTYGIIFLVPLLFAFRVYLGQHIHQYFASLPVNEVFSNAVKSLCKSAIIIVPSLILWQSGVKRGALTGTKPLTHSQPFWLLLLLMLPLVVAAGMQSQFRHTYPMIFSGEHLQNTSGIISVIFGELAYALDLATMEFLFRGLLVIALIRSCGKQAIIPAAVFYCVIHFGKPLLETISSFGGGLILGLISYHTRSYKGGIIIHVGIAWAMEILATLYR